MKRIGIVGGGTTGTSVLCQLVNKLLETTPDGSLKYEIHWWESNERFGHGLAWGEKNSDVQLFNLPAGIASVIPGQSGLFVSWCGEHGINASFASYPPRNTFGPFVENVAKETVERATAHGINVHMYPSSTVKGMDMIEGSEADKRPSFKASWETLDLTGLQHCIVDAVVFCTGPPALESQRFRHLGTNSHYIASPWPCCNLLSIQKTESVAVIGTGLTGVDVVKQLNAQGHKGPVIMVSRHGLLPAVKASVFDPFRPLCVATRDAVDATVTEIGMNCPGLLHRFLELIKREIIHFYDDFYSNLNENISTAVSGNGHSENVELIEAWWEAALSTCPRDGTAELEANITAQSTGSRSPWQDCTISLDMCDIPRYMWSLLCSEEKELFCSHYKTIFQVHFNTMPLCSATDLLSYLHSGWCQLRGRFNEVELVPNADKKDVFELSFTDGGKIAVDCVINATGFETSFAVAAESEKSPRVYLEMIRHGLVKADRFGGLQCDFGTGRLCQASEFADKNPVCCAPLLYGVGHIVSGTKLLTSGLSYCSGDASRTVNDLISNITDE